MTPLAFHLHWQPSELFELDCADGQRWLGHVSSYMKELNRAGK